MGMGVSNTYIAFLLSIQNRDIVLRPQRARLGLYGKRIASRRCNSALTDVGSCTGAKTRSVIRTHLQGREIRSPGVLAGCPTTDGFCYCDDL